MSENLFKTEAIFPLMEELTSIPAPAGHEENVRKWLRNRWQGKVLEWQEDLVGNICCKIGGNGKKILIQAHMDEIGFVVRHITSEGFLLVDSSQEQRRSSPEKRYMVGQYAQVIGRHHTVVAEGIFAAASGHVLTQSQLDKPHLDYDDFYIDIGTKSRAEVESLGIFVGASIIWSRPAKKIGGRIVSKALDDRMLLGIMDLLLNQIELTKLKYELWFGATVQEENGRHGANSLAHQQSFDSAIVLDVGLVGDTPSTPKTEHSTYLGGGPTVVHKDGGTHYDETILWKLVDIAKENGYPIQHGVYSNYNSDGAALMDHGIPSLLIGVPTRYTHTAFEMVDEEDIMSTVKVLYSFLQSE